MNESAQAPCYRQDVFAFIDFLGIAWTRDATALFKVKVADVLGWRDVLLAHSTNGTFDKNGRALADKCPPPDVWTVEIALCRFFL